MGKQRTEKREIWQHIGLLQLFKFKLKFKLLQRLCPSRRPVKGAPGIWGLWGALLRAARSLYDQSRSLDCIDVSKSDLFPVNVVLQQGCPLSPILLIIFMDRISRHSQGPEGCQVWGQHDFVRFSTRFSALFGWWCRVGPFRPGPSAWTGRSSVTLEELSVEPLLLHIERGQLRWLGHLFQMPPGRLPGKVFRAIPLGGDPGEDLGHAGGTVSAGWPGNASVSPQESWRKCLGRGKSGHLCLDCCPATGINRRMYTLPFSHFCCISSTFQELQDESTALLFLL